MRLEKPQQVRLGLQRQAPANLRRHVLRAANRFFVLVTADLATFGLLREVIRVVRDRSVLGEWLAGHVQAVLPGGYMNGWQFAVALLVALVVTGNYAPGDNRRETGRLFIAVAVATALPLWTALWSRGLEPVLVQYGLTVTFVWLGLVAERLAIDGIIARVRAVGRNAADTLFVGTAEECRRVMGSAAFHAFREYRQIGFVDVGSPQAPGSLGSAQDFALVLAASGAEIVVVCGHLDDAQFQEVVDAARLGGCQLLSAPRAWNLAGVQPTLVWKDGHPVIALTSPVVRAPELFIKRVMDLVLSVVGLFVLSPAIGLLAALIKLDSPGPAFFRSERWGRGGRRIWIWKFRTMVNGAAVLLETDPSLREAYNHNVKLVADPRVTWMGKWLRRWSLDELPQLFNVLVGEMSLVGPRPKLIGEEQRYEGIFDIVLSVPPGMTGLWQVSGRNNLSYEERVALDVDYVRRCSLWLDLRILFQTVPVVLRGVGAH
ncbi:MAG: exopolysaccharide biosynthesis polyprenyl glycosylphosphotransferase [Candidatus Methylomirabilaceae bacterium]